ncbi:hypothetical protein Cfor_04162 [Coptotermes formosanus]|uniref:Uncharacterized protein n=1 Tax=Coptotermes formosanus TaxID=36987 RepID=A0A6L2Q2U1_COPFO|nr:hypothetical protein Cfor_04162 [Coptotermes formosanus]
MRNRAGGLSLKDLKHTRNVEHKGRHHHTTQHSTSPPEVEEVTETSESSCCSRQAKFVPIGFGGSGEVVRLDVGHCQKSCTSVPSLVEPDFVDFRSSVAKPCAGESACLPSRSRVQRVSTLRGMQEVPVVEECGCSYKQERCYRHPHTLQLHPGTPYETHLDVGACSGRCDSEFGCRPVKNRTVSVPGPNGVQCHSVIEECSCTAGCYRMSYLETVYDYADFSDDTVASPTVMEIDVGQCTGLCSGGQTQKCLYRDRTDSSKCLASLYGKQSSCTPARFEVYRYTTKDRQIKELISIKDCKCM